MTMTGRVATVFPDGEDDPNDAPDKANDLVAAFAGTAGVEAGVPARQRIGGRQATVIDLRPAGSERVALYGTDGQTFYLETSRTTRVYVVDAKSGPVVITVEPVDGSTLEAILPAATDVINSLRFR
jgi:hypothetical protein